MNIDTEEIITRIAVELAKLAMEEIKTRMKKQKNNKIGKKRKSKD